MSDDIPDQAVIGLYMQDGVIYAVAERWTKPGGIEARVMSTVARRPEYSEQEKADMDTTKVRAFLREIADMRTDGEEDDDGEEFVMENDDAVETLNSLIEQARELLGQ